MKRELSMLKLQGIQSDSLLDEALIVCKIHFIYVPPAGHPPNAIAIPH